MSITGRRRKMCNPLVTFIVHVLMSIIGLVVGIAAALAFGIKFNNPHAAGWAAVSSIFALILLVVVILVYKKKLNNWWLTLFALIGATGVVLGSTAFVLYIILGVYDKKKPPLPESYYIVAVWSFMLVKHSTVLTWVTCSELVKLIKRQQRYQQMSAEEETNQ